MDNALIVISGPSGVGKGTIVKELLKRDNFALSVSCTTRAPREGEEDGKSYFFITKEQFEKMIEEGGFLEYSNHFENFYGTPKAFVEEKLKTQDVLLEIEPDGALQVKKAYPDVLLIMIAPPSEKELLKRLKKRGSESRKKIKERIARCRYELSKKDEYDVAVINDNLQTAVDEIDALIRIHKLNKQAENNKINQGDK